MRFLSRFRLTIAALALWPFAANLRADQETTVDAHSVLVTNFQGWGTSLCWWANVVSAYSNRQEYADLAFKDLKLNIVRYNIGGGENPDLTNTITNFRAKMPGFEPTKGVWDWSADAPQRWMLRTSIAMGANIVDAFANSPPWWMTISGSVTGAPHGTNNLQPAAENDFAVYLATVVSNLTILDGIHFNFVTPINEPTGGWSYNNKKQEGCHMTPDQQARMITALARELKKTAPGLGIDGPEDYSEQDSIDDLKIYNREALGSLDIVSTHTYKADNPAGLQHAAASLGKPVWMAEYGDGDATGLTMAQRIHDDITGMKARAWIYWQVVDNGYGWGFLYNPLASTKSWRFTEKYEIYEKFYVMEQYSKFIRPGCNILTVNDTNTLAAYDPTYSTLTLVAFNKSGTNFNASYHFAGFAATFSHAAAYRTSASEKAEPLPSTALANQTLTAEIPSKSVTTFVLTTGH